MEPRRNIALLRAFDALPALLDMAEQGLRDKTENVYTVQDALRAQYRQERKPFRWSMPYRHLASCPQCSYVNAEIRHELENPAILDSSSPHRYAVISELEIHGIREHGWAFPEPCQAFLEHLDVRPDG